MKLNINFQNMQGGGDIIDYIDHRVSFAFARTRHEIDNTKITITDINGPKGGVDKQCKVIIKPRGMKPIVIAEKRESVRNAIDRCLTRASHSINRKLKRKRSLCKKPSIPIELAPEETHVI